MRGLFSVVVAAALLTMLVPTTAGATPQLRVSPGPLAHPHASLEGVANCGRCHESARRPAGSRCLVCHQPIAQRMAQKRGVHRNVTGDCGACHAEHGGEDVDLRRIDRQTFNHELETGFGLDGQHARIASTCTDCHKKRSFLGLATTCSSCHADPHKSTLGRECTLCHSTRVPFKQTRRAFDHVRTKFALTGAHREVACEKCHIAGVFRGLRFDACSSCHVTPHRRVLGPACTSCHVTDSWTTRSLDHMKTAFPLVGAHTRVACAKCHATGVRQPLRFDRCSACHANVHRESVRDDCGRCHTPAAFRPATFDHRAATAFPLEGQHEPLACRKCHTRIESDDIPALRRVVDFGGVQATCTACHKDRHQGEFGRACEACHRASTFKAAGFVHPRMPAFFGGLHTGVACVKCHVRSGLQTSAKAPPSVACAGCHSDVHLGQLGVACDRCHDVSGAKFAPARFTHDTTRFPLTGKHRPLACEKCHSTVTAQFPSGAGTARRFAGVSTDCSTCHKDPHLGQVTRQCEACHTPETFQITSYAHQGLEKVFGTATHDRLPCRSCHKKETGDFPAGRGTTMRLKVGRTCLGCHP